MNKVRGASWAFWVAGFAVLFVFYLRVFVFEPVISDAANALLAAQDMAAGNWRLRGWHLGLDNFWGLDLALGAIFWKVTANGLLTLRLVATVGWAGLMGLTTYLGTQSKPTLQTLAILAALILVPVFGPITGHLYFSVPFHVLTVLGMFVAVVMCDKILNVPENSWSRTILLALITMNCAASDPFFQFILALPLIIALALDKAPLKRRISLGLLFLICVALGGLLVRLNAATGGFIRVVPDPPNLVTIKDIPASISKTLFGWLGVLGCWPQSQSLFERILAVLRIPLILLLIAPVLGCLRRFKTLKFLDRALLLMVGANICAVILSGEMIGAEGERFLVPAWAAASILAARFVRHDVVITRYCLGVAVLTLGAVISSVGQVHGNGARFSSGETAYINALDAHGLSRGYAFYWRASDTTVASDGRLRVAAITLAPRKTLIAYDWFSKQSWYLGDPSSKTFFVSLPADTEPSPLQLVINTFGKPDSVFETRRAASVFWGKDTDVSIMTFVYDRSLPAIP